MCMPIWRRQARRANYFISMNYYSISNDEKVSFKCYSSALISWSNYKTLSRAKFCSTCNTWWCPVLKEKLNLYMDLNDEWLLRFIPFHANKSIWNFTQWNFNLWPQQFQTQSPDLRARANLSGRKIILRDIEPDTACQFFLLINNSLHLPYQEEKQGWDVTAGKLELVTRLICPNKVLGVVSERQNRPGEDLRARLQSEPPRWYCLSLRGAGQLKETRNETNQGRNWM